jgi:hypothetical protein
VRRQGDSPSKDFFSSIFPDFTPPPFDFLGGENERNSTKHFAISKILITFAARK